MRKLQFEGKWCRFLIINGAKILVALTPFCSLAFGQNSDDLISEADLSKLRLFIGEAAKKRDDDGTVAGLIDGKYVVRPGDTLSDIVNSKIGVHSLNRKLLQDVIVSLNSDAFRRGNPHWLMAGATLKIPSADDIMTYIVPARQTTGPEITQEDWITFP